MTDNLLKLNQAQPLECLEAMTKRDFDLELLADQIEAGCMVPAPRDLKASILREAARPEVQLEIKTRELSRKVQLLLYSLKVGTAVAGALFLLSVAPRLGAVDPALVGYRQESCVPDPQKTIREQSKKIDGFFRQFSNDIFQNGGTTK